MHRKWVSAIVDLAGRRPFTVIFLVLTTMAGFFAVASRLEIRSDLLELLPEESAGKRALLHQLGQVGGGSTLIVVVESPDRAANERAIDELAARLERLGPAQPLVAYVESSTKDVRRFYEDHKWLYASVEELQKSDDDLDHAIARRSGLVSDLEEEEPKALGLAPHLDRWAGAAKKNDTFPSGYFATEDGTMIGLRIVSNTTLGHRDGDVLLGAVEREVAALPKPETMKIGLTGDIASAADEKRALVSDAAWATIGAFVVILGALALYYRSVWSLAVIALPAIFGVGAAYAFATAVFGYVNTCGAFLGAIILGNGINYPIVLLSRYRDFVARGMAPAEARREAVLNALRAELVGAAVASIAYGSLFATHFRGFNQFGAIGFVGMIVVWASIVPIVPAMVAIGERFAKPAAPLAISKYAALPALHPKPFLAFGILVIASAFAVAPSYLRDPWEWDLGRLGSKSSDKTGAGEWSNKANQVFGGKMNIAGARMLADTPEQVPLLKRAMLANDAADPKGSMIAEITTLDDLLPTRQSEKLVILERIRERLSARVIDALDGTEKTTVLSARPPEDLRVLGPHDLPPLLLRRFTEADGRVGTVFYVKPRNEVVFADGHNHLRFSRITDNVALPDGTVVMTASRSTLFAEMLSSIRRDGPIASAIAAFSVIFVVILAARSRRSVVAVLGGLLFGVAALVLFAAITHARINYVSFIALPITLGIGCEYPFNVVDRARLLGGDPAAAILRSGGAVVMCSFTTVVGYGSLVFSDFQALQSFGELAVVGEVGCLFGALAFAPAILAVRSRTSSRGA